MKNVRVITLLVLFLFVYQFSAYCADTRAKNLEILVDSVKHLFGKDGFVPVNESRMQLARELNDTLQIEGAYVDLFNHYYQLGEVDSLKIVGYQLMDFYADRKDESSRYQIWRQYIQRLTENGKQDEAIAETDLLSKDAEQKHSHYGRASAEMCIGYNHRVFGNNAKLCTEYYNKALKTFEDAKFYTDAYTVCLNIVQTYLSSQEYALAPSYIHQMERLGEKMKADKKELPQPLYMRFLQFRVISALANQGKIAAQKYILEADRYYFSNPGIMPKDAWFGYKIMYYRMLKDVDMALVYLDSMQDYHKSIGACYPANILLKAQYLEESGRYKEACKVYVEYAHVNDSVRSAELDDKLSEYTVKFDVDKLKMEKLELSASVTRNRLITVLTIGCCILILLVILSYFYIRLLAMNKKLDAANKAVVKASRIKSSFIQHITHEIRTPLNSIVGFSSLIAAGGLSDEENKDYSIQIEESNTYLLDLVNNVVDIADMDSLTETMPKRVVDVDACCKECISEILPTLKKSLELQYEPPTEQVTLTAVYPWMKRVLLALLSNASKFSDSGFIRLKYEYDKPNKFVRFIIEDTGVGIDEEYKDSIFERFVKVDKFSPGTGLGLAVVHQIMEIVDGKAYLDTTYTGGARFVVEWPVE